MRTDKIIIERLKDHIDHHEVVITELPNGLVINTAELRLFREKKKLCHITKFLRRNNFVSHENRHFIRLHDSVKILPNVAESHQANIANKLIELGVVIDEMIMKYNSIKEIMTLHIIDEVEELQEVTLKTKSFIKKAISKHSDKYDYSKVNYVKSHERVTIICKKHGPFEQVANTHLKGSGCPNCSSTNRPIKTIVNSIPINFLNSINEDPDFNDNYTPLFKEFLATLENK